MMGDDGMGKMKKKTATVLAVIGGIVLGSVIEKIFVMFQSSEGEEKWKKLSNKHLELMLLLNQWLYLKQQGKSIIDYFHRENINTIAIYGMSYIGERLYDDLKDSDVTVKYAIDRNADTIYSEIAVMLPNDKLDEIDAVIVTSITYFAEIENELSGKISCPIISLKDILYQL